MQTRWMFCLPKPGGGGGCMHSIRSKSMARYLGVSFYDKSNILGNVLYNLRRTPYLSFTSAINCLAIPVMIDSGVFTLRPINR